MIPVLTFIYDRKKQATKTKPAVVELKIQRKGVRKYISTGVLLLPREWKDGCVVGRQDWRELNDQLQMFKRKCSEIVTRLSDEGGFDMNAVKTLLDESMMQQQTFLEYARACARRRYAKIADGTKEHYELWFRFMEKWRGIVHFTDITERNVQRLDDKLTEMGLKECSRWSYHKILKTFVISALNDGLVKRNPYARLDIKKGGEDGLKKVLEPAEFHRFERCEIPVEHLRRVRDLFVFQTYTMMSYSDLAAFDFKNCIKTKMGFVYKSNRLKTGQEFTLVLLKPALDVLKKYKYKLPIISNVKYNDYLKAAVAYAGIDKRVTTHWARHTGATMLLNEGKVPMHIVQHILGHSSIRETEKTYAKVLDSSIVDAMAGLNLG